MQKYKIYEGDTLRACLKKLLDDKRRPATIKQIYDLKNQKKIPIQWYDTGTLYYKGEIKTATLKQLKDIENIYKKGGRVLFVDGRSSLGLLYGSSNLDNYGCFVGVKK